MQLALTRFHWQRSKGMGENGSEVNHSEQQRDEYICNEKADRDYMVPLKCSMYTQFNKKLKTTTLRL